MKVEFEANELLYSVKDDGGLNVSGGYLNFESSGELNPFLDK